MDMKKMMMPEMGGMEEMGEGSDVRSELLQELIDTLVGMKDGGGEAPMGEKKVEIVSMEAEPSDDEMKV